MKKKGIISFDLDMTLLDHNDWKIPESAMRAVAALRKKYIIVIGSGRDMDNVYSCQYRDIIKPDAIIHSNGTKVTVGDTLIYEHFMNRELLRQIVSFVQDKPYAVGLTSGDEDYYTNPEYVVKHDEQRWKESNRNFMPPEKMMDLDIRTLTYLGGVEGVRELETKFPELKLPMFSGGQGADVVEKVASKAEGLKRLCKYYDIPLTHTVAFGDSMNDYEIVKVAGIGIAMGNALEALKQVADYVTDRIDEDGVYNACVALGLIPAEE